MDNDKHILTMEDNYLMLPDDEGYYIMSDDDDDLHLDR